MSENKNQVAQKEEAKTIKQQVSLRVQELTSNGELIIPKGYSYENALSSAWLKLMDLKDKNNKPVLDVCTKPSIQTALMRMVTQGMNPIKEQCYFMAYGDQLTFQRSYQGSVALAKRVAKVKDVNAKVIFEGDEYVTETNEKAITRLLVHRSPIENRDINKIKGAYAVVEFEDGSLKLEEMSLPEIKRAWAMGFGGGNTKAHQNFTDQMCIKTVKTRAVKSEINSSSDSDLYDDDSEVLTKGNESPNIPKSANSDPLTFDDHEEVKDEPKAIESKPEVNIPAKEKDKVLQNASGNGSLFEGQAKEDEKDPF